MAYRYGNRAQKDLFPQSIEEYVAADDPVRVYDSFVDALNLKDLGFKINSCKVGNSSYDPTSMLKLFLYGYSYGWRSSRKLERAIHHNISFIWLMGGLKPDHKTIAEFRRNNTKALSEIMKACARFCLKLNLIDGNTLFIDGTKQRANASINAQWTKAKCEKRLRIIDQRIEKILLDCERIDQSESNTGSLVKMKEELKDQEQLKSTIKAIFDELQETDSSSLNTTDRDCAPMRGRQGSHASYNVQHVVDGKNGLIVSTDVTNESNDKKQLATQVKQAHLVLGKKSKTVCADAGYANTTEAEEIVGEKINVVMPSQRQALHKPQKPFSKEVFIYEKEHDRYRCPEGHCLTFKGINRKKNIVYTK